MPERPPSVKDDPQQSRYEVFVDGELAGFAAYDAKPGRLVFTHTQIDPSFSGHGVGSALAREALDDVRRRGMLATPRCPFIAAFIRDHREYVDLVDDEHRSAFAN